MDFLSYSSKKNMNPLPYESEDGEEGGLKSIPPRLKSRTKN